VGTSSKSISYKDAEGNTCTKNIRIVYEVIVRTIDKHGQILLTPAIELNTWWTNLVMSDDEVISLYQAHGESEQYHSEIKTDMDVERLPSGKFETNQLVLELAILAYNILRMMGQESLRADDARKLKRPVRRRRLRTVIGNLILIAGHITKHSRRVVLALGRSNIWRHPFMRLYHRFPQTKLI
jgi:protein required for attachment to host cells